MIVWINGPFGVGKTSVARQLVDTWTDAILFDPELLGCLVRRLVPAYAHVDYQTLALWRDTVVAFARSLDRHHHGPIVIPMTLWNPEYHDEVIGGLLTAGIDVRHFTLMASKAALLERISLEDKEKGWRSSHMEACLASLVSARFAVHLETDRRTVFEVAEWIISQVRIG